MKKLVGFVSVGVVASLVLTGSAMAAKNVQKTINLPADFSAAIQTANCSALPGPQVTIQSELHVSGLKAETVFSNPKGEAGTERFVVEQTVIPDNSQVNVPSQTIVGAVSNDPYMWLQLTDAKGKVLTSEMFLGRCSQASFSPTVNLAVPVDVIAEVSSSDCASATGPVVSINDGTADLSAIHGKLIFRNTSDPNAGRGPSGEATIDLMLF